MAVIRLDKFGGLAPKIAPNLLPATAATAAQNCRLGSGALTPWRLPSHVADLVKSGVKKSIYRYAGQFWFHWLEDVNLVQAPVALDAYGRVYWTGEGYPRVGGSDVVTSGGGTAYPTASYRMGVPAPTAPPTCSVSGTPSDSVPPVDRVYVCTYVTQYGAEGPPSDPSLEVLVANGQTVTVTLPGAPTGNYNVTQKNVYRTVKGSSDSEYMLVGTVPVATTTFLDDRLDADLTTALPSLAWDGPPDDMAGLVAHPMGSLLGFSGKELLLSVPFRPHAWPYRYAVTDPIVALGVFGTTILVATGGKPYLISGSDPSAMTVEQMEKGESCVSKRGFVDMGPACLYPGPSGLWGAGLGDIALLTEKIMNIEQWQAYAPETILGAQYDGNYIGFYDNGTVQAGFVFDPQSGDFTDIDTYATAAWNDPLTGTLYLVVNGELVQWNGGSTFYSVTWRARPYWAGFPRAMSCARVFADAYPVTLKIYADDSLQHTQTVADNRPFRLPGKVRGTKWEAEISGVNTVKAILFGDNMTELAQQTL